MTAVPPPPHVFSVNRHRLVYACFQRDEAGNGSGGFQLREVHSQELAPTAFQNGLLGGPVRDLKEFGDQLGAFLRRITVPVRAASLVLPDAWLRVAFAEVGELPKDPAGREDLVRWKLRRLVPFRVEDLRVEAVEVSPLSRQEEPRRLLLGFGLEVLLAQLEALFEQVGVRIGRISSTGLCLLAAIEKLEETEMLALAVVQEDGYTLLFARRGEPVLQRFKASSGEMPFEARQRLVGRDLRLTRTFLDEQFPGSALSRAYLMAPPDLEGPWLDWLEDGLGVRTEPLGESHLPRMTTTGGSGNWLELAPMLGASRLEVA